MKLELSLRRLANPLVRAARRAFRRRGEEGATLVEFAITLPILVATLTGTCSVAMGMYSLQQLANTTSVAVQAVANNPGLAADADPCAEAASVVTTTLPGWKSANFSYSMTITYVEPGTTTVTSATYTAAEGVTFTCGSSVVQTDGTTASGELTQNYPIELTVTYAYSWLPILNFKHATINLTSAQGASAN